MTEFADWTRAFVMMAHDGTVYRPVLVDELGNLYALLQGMTPDDELRTVRLDEEGRISAFVIDSVDAWGKMLSIGNAELAARMGSPVIYEQTGRVQFIEAFEHGLGLWSQASDGAGKAIAIDPIYTRSGGYSAKLTGGRDGLRYAQLTYCQGISPVKAIGVAFAYSAPTDFDNIHLTITLWDTTHTYETMMEISGLDDKVYIYDHLGDPQDVLTINPATGLARTFFFVKITFDPATGYYKQLRFNQHLRDLSDHRFIKEVAPALPLIELILRVTSVSGENDIVYFDDIIITTAEP